MTKRNHRFEMRLTKDEYYDMTKKARKAGMTTASFVRKAVAEEEVKEGPTADTMMLIKEVREVGNTLSAILHELEECYGDWDYSPLKKALHENREVEKIIREAYT